MQVGNVGISHFYNLSTNAYQSLVLFGNCTTRSTVKTSRKSYSYKTFNILRSQVTVPTAKPPLRGRRGCDITCDTIEKHYSSDRTKTPKKRINKHLETDLHSLRPSNQSCSQCLLQNGQSYFKSTTSCQRKDEETSRKTLTLKPINHL